MFTCATNAALEHTAQTGPPHHSRTPHNHRALVEDQPDNGPDLVVPVQNQAAARRPHVPDRRVDDQLASAGLVQLAALKAIAHGDANPWMIEPAGSFPVRRATLFA